MTDVRSAALVSAAGGAGATRLCVECGATLARDGQAVAILDAAFGSQGLARHVQGTLDPDLTGVLLDADAALDDALVSLDWTVPGRVDVAPAFAPFERVARAKAPDAAERLGDLVETAADRYDRVLLDVGPVASNPAVAGVTAADRVAAVVPPTDRGTDALQRTRGRLADVGADLDRVVVNRADPGVDPPDADHVVPEREGVVAGRPACLDGTAPFAPAVGELAADLLECDLALDFERGLVDAARRRLDG